MPVIYYKATSYLIHMLVYQETNMIPLPPPFFKKSIQITKDFFLFLIFSMPFYYSTIKKMICFVY